MRLIYKILCLQIHDAKAPTDFWSDLSFKLNSKQTWKHIWAHQENAFLQLQGSRNSVE